MKCPKCGFNPDPVNEPELADEPCLACDDDGPCGPEVYADLDDLPDRRVAADCWCDHPDDDGTPNCQRCGGAL